MPAKQTRASLDAAEEPRFEEDQEEEHSPPENEPPEGMEDWDAEELLEPMGLGEAATHEIAQQGLVGSPGPLPHLEAIQRSFGASHDLSSIQVFVGGPAAAAAARLGVPAYARGNQIAFACAPSLHLAAHEAAHVIQQRGGAQLPSGLGMPGDSYEQKADAVADLVVRGESAAELLGAPGAERSAKSASSVQMKCVTRRLATRVAGAANQTVRGASLSRPMPLWTSQAAKPLTTYSGPSSRGVRSRTEEGRRGPSREQLEGHVRNPDAPARPPKAPAKRRGPEEKEMTIDSDQFVESTGRVAARGEGDSTKRRGPEEKEMTIDSDQSVESTGRVAARGDRGRAGERVTEPKPGVWEDIDPEVDVANWKFEDMEKMEGDLKVVTTLVTVGDKRGWIERAYNPRTGEFQMRNAFLTDLPRWVDKGTPLVEGKGTPTVTWLTIRMMKVLGMDFAGASTVKMSTIQNLKAIIQLHALRMAGVEADQAVMHTHSVSYAETSLVQSGHRVVKAVLGGNKTTTPIGLLMKHFEGAPPDPAIVAKHDAQLAQYGEGKFTRETEMWWNYDIVLTVVPASPGDGSKPERAKKGGPGDDSRTNNADD